MPISEGAAGIGDIHALINAGAIQVTQKLLPIGKNLTLGFGTLLTAWTGIKMMIEPKQPNGMLVGDILNLILHLGFALALLENYNYLVVLLKDSAGAIIEALGLHETNLIISSLTYLWGLPSVLIDQLHGVEIEWSFTNFGQNALVYVLSLVLVAIIYLFIMASILSITLTMMIGLALLGLVMAIGPICVPFIMLPKLDKLFWSWIDGVLYGISLKITVAVMVVFVTEISKQSIPTIVTVQDGTLSLNMPQAFMAMTTVAITVLLFKQAYVIAGLFAGTRLALNPTISWKP